MLVRFFFYKYVGLYGIPLRYDIFKIVYNEECWVFVIHPIRMHNFISHIIILSVYTVYYDKMFLIK